jgi:hypothetical protein
MATLIARYRKAIAAFLGSTATWGIAAGADGHYTQVELWGLLGIVAATAGVGWVSNARAKPKDRGAGELGTILICAAVAIVVVAIYVVFVKK